MISSRQAAILEAVINRYIRTAEPVGSKAVADDCALGVSPATIRNDMGALEDMGYLVQPHTSAGRVPTDKGYRLYVDTLRKTLEIAEDDASSLLNKLAELRRLETEEMVRRVSSVVASRTCTIGLAMNPQSSRVYFWGISQLLHQPEFMDTRRIEFLVELLEGEHQLAEMLAGESGEATVHVTIGSENRMEELAGLSLVSAGYSKAGEPAGIIGLLGPTRMDYETAIPMVDFTARNLSRLLEEV